MSTRSQRLRSGVRELIRTEGTTLEDLHIIATDVVEFLDKLASRLVRKLRPGQAIRCYNEDSKKEYGQRGSDVRCFFREMQDTNLSVYTAKHEWSVSVDCLLESYDEFDPDSEEGKKRSKKKKKTRGRRSKKRRAQEDPGEFDTQWTNPPRDVAAYEPEELDEEYDFSNAEEYAEYFDDV
jgi:hypothetical protein